MATRTCRDCNWWCRDELDCTTSGYDVGECRRHPPVINLAYEFERFRQDDEAVSDPDDVVLRLAKWPHTEGDSFCGEVSLTALKLCSECEDD